MTDHWLILRTASRSTLALAESLAKSGYDVWTPVRTFNKRAPRRREISQVVVPMLPSFAFAKASHIHALLEMAEAFTKPCPDFSVFHYLNDIPLVRDEELESLRNLEARDRRQAEIERFKTGRQIRFKGGETIRIDEGAFAGMDGVVQYDDGKYAMVSFGRTKVKIATFLLANDNVQEPQRA